MQENHARVRLLMGSNEIELEGTEEFVRSMFEEIRTELSSGSHGEGSETSDLGGESGVQHKSFPASFGEYLLGFELEKDTDRILVAARYAQHTAEDNAFTTNEVNELLVDQGVKVSNASQSVKQNVTSKRVFKLSKGKYRVSNNGESHIQELRTSGT